MNSDRQNELAALGAVGALDGDDLQEFDALKKAADPDFASQVAAFTDTAALLANAQINRRTPPASLKQKVLDRIAATAAVVPAPSNAPARNPFFSVLASEGQWKTLPFPGVRLKDLASDPERGYSMFLLELAPGAKFPEHRHSAAEECFVLSGDFHVEGRVLHAGDFHHAETETQHHESFTENGCQLLLVVSAKDYVP